MLIYGHYLCADVQALLFHTFITLTDYNGLRCIGSFHIKVTMSIQACMYVTAVNRGVMVRMYTCGSSLAASPDDAYLIFSKYLWCLLL